jgi:peptide/nickel transport system substrate-binding protein
MQRMSRRVVAMLLMLSLTAVAGCSQQTSGGGRPVEGGVLTLGVTRAPGIVLNPLVAGESEVTRLVYSRLLTQGAQLEPVCDLCERYTVSPDQRAVTFSLRKDVQWHDGKPFTAADVAWTLRAVLHPAYTGPRAGQLSALAGVQPLLDERDARAREVAAGRLTAGMAAHRNQAAWNAWLKGPGAEAIATPDDRTVVLRLAEPYGPLLAQLMLPVLPAHVFGGVDVAEMAAHEASRRPVGTGPYKLVEHQPGELIRLARHDAFHAGKPWIPKVTLLVVKPTELAGALQSGAVDWALVDGATAEALKGDREVWLVEHMAFGYQYLGLSHDLPLFADRRVRQALLHAINREGLVAGVLQGHGMVVNHPLQALPWATETAGLNTYPYSSERAAALLAEAGWQERNKDGWLVRDGRVFSFTLKVPRGNKPKEESAARIREDLKQVGIRVVVEPVEFVQLVREVFDERTAQAWLLGWDVALDPDPGPAYLRGNKWGNATGWEQPRHEDLLKQAVRALEPANRKPLYAEWSRLVNEEVPVLYLYAENEVEAVRVGRIRGVRPDPRGLSWNVWEWWIAERGSP